MNTELWRKAQAIFDEAVSLETETARNEFLHQACGDDQDCGIFFSWESAMDALRPHFYEVVLDPEYDPLQIEELETFAQEHKIDASDFLEQFEESMREYSKFPCVDDSPFHYEWVIEERKVMD